MTNEIYIAKKNIQKIKKHCRSVYPLEACGILVGKENLELNIRKTYVINIIETENISKNPKNRYEIDPLFFIKEDRKLEGSLNKIIGIYHSHPDGTIKPSLVDIDLMWPVFSYIIISMKSNKEITNITSWKMTNKDYDNPNKSTIEEEVIRIK